MTKLTKAEWMAQRRQRDRDAGFTEMLVKLHVTRKPELKAIVDKWMEEDTEKVSSSSAYNPDDYDFRNRLTKDQDTEIRRRYEGGQVSLDIANEMKIGKNSVYRSLKRQGVPLWHRKEITHKEQRSLVRGRLDLKSDEIKHRYLQDKLSVRALSAEFGVSMVTMLKWMDENNVPRRPNTYKANAKPANGVDHE
jgi:hypothetical protein